MAKQSALVFSGGGAHGAYAVGVSRALAQGDSAATRHRPLDPDIFTGTSVGAFNAAFLTSHWERSFQEATALLAKTWIEILSDHNDAWGNGVYRYRANPLKYLNPFVVGRDPFKACRHLLEDSVHLPSDLARRVWWFVFRSQGDPVNRLLKTLDLATFMSLLPFERTLRKTIDYEKVRASPKKLVIASSDWQSGNLVVTGNAEMTSEMGPVYIRGSASIPGVFPPKAYGSGELVDGAVLMNTPLRLAIEAGADVLYVVSMEPLTSRIPTGTIPSTINRMIRANAATWNHQLRITMRGISLVNETLQAFWDLRREYRSRRIDPGLRKYVSEVLGDVRQFTREVFRSSPLRRLTIHLLRPRAFLGGQPIEMLTFERKLIEQYMAAGFQDAVDHDCGECGCILSDPSDDNPSWSTDVVRWASGHDAQETSRVEERP